MTTVLVRFAKRRANWEDDSFSPEELQRREFKAKDGGPDLRPSVYEVDPATELLRCYAEHAAGFDPPVETIGLETRAGLGVRVERTDGETPFEFTRNRHHEFVLSDERDLMTLIRLTRAQPHHTVTKAQIVEYVKRMLEQGDPEWEAQASLPKPKKWLRSLRRSS